MRKILNITLIIILLIGAGFIYWKFYFVYGEGAKSGELNYVVKKGNVFKTYEGKLIQAGLRSKAPNTIQSNEFEFSVDSKRVAELLLSKQGYVVNLHYKEYHGALPWRGYTRYIVDSIISISESIR
jgi:hypothetical protein